MTKFEEFAKEIGFNQQVLDNYVTFADAHYNTFYIAKKKKNKKRKIDCPSKELKAIQRWILTRYLSSFPVSVRANGFIEGRGIKRNKKKIRDKQKKNRKKKRTDRKGLKVELQKRRKERKERENKKRVNLGKECERKKNSKKKMRVLK